MRAAVTTSGTNPKRETRAPAVGVVLAGGRSSRMGGGDKTLLTLGGTTILARVVGRARPQVAALVLNVNGDARRFADYKLPIAADSIAGFAGPLAGILAGMDWAAATHPAVEWLASFAADAPFFPHDLVDRLFAAITEHGAELACARSGGRSHPVFGLWPVRLRTALRTALVEEGVRKVDAFTRNFRLVELDVKFDAFDPFYNINRIEDLQQAEKWAASDTY